MCVQWPISQSQPRADLETIWRSSTDRAAFSPNLRSNAYLAALACAEDLVLVTFDKGFTQFPGLKFTILP